MEEKNDAEKSIDDIMLPGFRFHPTDEELVEFYLKKKLQHKTLPIELIKQVDIYKYDPWDLPKLASTGEKEWYFYCPRDRKYRNSTRPNGVTGSGFWKATGTDRPIYSSDGTKCISLKKSLVFYRGQAAKGLKTNWMMHEYRLSSATDGAPTPTERILDKNLPAPDSWAICRIFKKTNSMAQRTLSHYWAASLSETTSSPDVFTYHTRFNTENDDANNFSALNIPCSYKTISTITGKPFPVLSAHEQVSNRTTVDLTCILSPALDFGGLFDNGHSVISSNTLRASMNGEDDDEFRKNQSTANIHNRVWENIRSIGFPFSLPSDVPDSIVN